MNNWLLIAFIISYAYAAGITMWFLRETYDIVQWPSVISIGIFWPLALVGFLLGFLFLFFVRYLPQKYKNWKWKRSPEYRKFAEEIEEEISQWPSHPSNPSNTQT